MLKQIFKNSLVRQIVGAGGGALIALLCYGAYGYAADGVAALIPDSPVAEQTVDFDAPHNADAFRRIGEHVREEMKKVD